MAAFRQQRAAPPVEQVTIGRIDDDPEFAKVARYRRAVIAGRDDRQRQIDALMIEAELARSGTGPRAMMMRERLARLRLVATDTEAVTPPAASADDVPTDLALGLRLLAGEVVEPPPGRDARLQKLRAELTIFERAYADAERWLDDVCVERSHAAAVELVPRHQAALRTMHDAAVALARATAAERQVVAEFLIAGYRGEDHILRRPACAGAARLGGIDEHDLDVSMFTRALQAQGVLP